MDVHNIKKNTIRWREMIKLQFVLKISRFYSYVSDDICKIAILKTSKHVESLKFNEWLCDKSELFCKRHYIQSEYFGDSEAFHLFSITYQKN